MLYFLRQSKIIETGNLNLGFLTVGPVPSPVYRVPHWIPCLQKEEWCPDSYCPTAPQDRDKQGTRRESKEHWGTAKGIQGTLPNFQVILDI